MAFNPTFEARRKPSTRAISEDRASSFFSDSQSSWVVFNHTEPRPHDILSLSTENPLSETEDETGSVGHGQSRDLLQEPKILFSGKISAQAHVPDEETIEKSQVPLSSRINEWQESADNSVVSDNVASWDLDEDLISQVLDTTILRRVPAYYGDSCFKDMSPAEFARFQRSSAILQKSLTRKGYDTSDPELVPRLARLLNWRDLLRTSGSLVDDYIANTLSRANFQDRTYRDVEISDTATSSSLIICGAGTGDSWNDI